MLHVPRRPQAGGGDPFLEVEAYDSPEGRAFLDGRDASFLARVAELGLGKSKLLFLGVGTGRLMLKVIASLKGSEGTGIDMCGPVLPEGLDKARGLGLVGRVWIVEGDACRLSLPDHCFDAVLCDDLLHHVSDPACMLAEICRVLRPGGAVLIRDGLRPLRRPWSWFAPAGPAQVPDVLRAARAASLQAAYTLGEIRRWAVGSGLSGVRVWAEGDCGLISRPYKEA
ncbi:MAG: methyltransferase domain-containing protein [Elusimicrobiota bacterium]|jgi:ubiquinone/menaquinone biosynthesis C-methylase UbiE